MSDVLGLNPPRYAHSDPLRWALLRAFAPPVTRCVISDEGVRGAELACRLGLADRIWSRVPEEQIRRELGPGAQKLAFSFLATRAAHGQMLGALQRVVRAARALEIPVVLLKYGALASGGYTQPGSRDARDLDVLVPSERAASLQERLQDDGMTPIGQRAPRHHLPGLRNERGEAVEVHRFIPGLLHNGRELEAADILREGWAQRTEIDGGIVFIPARHLLIAHATVHGVVQHLESPLNYTLTRMLCDLSDLGAGRPEFRASSVAHWLEEGTSSVELDAVCSLVRLLEAGLQPKPGSVECILLSHIVASACDPAYQDQLRVRRLITLFRTGQLAQSLRAVSWPDRGAAQRLVRAILNRPHPVATWRRLTNVVRGAATEVRAALPPRLPRDQDL